MFNDKLDKILMKKGKRVSPMEQRAKSDVLSKFGAEEDSEESGLAKRLAGLKKVSVAAPDEEGLEKGLDKAKELVKGMPEEGHEMMESPMEEKQEEKLDLASLSPDEIDEKIQMLLELKKQLKDKEEVI